MGPVAVPAGLQARAITGLENAITAAKGASVAKDSVKAAEGVLNELRARKK